MIAEFLEDLVSRHREDYRDGAVATYIPELAKVDPRLLGIAMAFQDGRVVEAGDATVRFAIESISKTAVLALALLDHGEEQVFHHMQEEPSGDAFNYITKLQTSSTHVPSNPYINAGAILTTSLIKGNNADHRFQRILDFLRKITETPDLDLDRETYLSEKATGDTNRSLAWMMKSYGDITGDIEEILDVYFRQCSIRVTAVALAKMGRFFAAGGRGLGAGIRRQRPLLLRRRRQWKAACRAPLKPKFLNHGTHFDMSARRTIQRPKRVTMENPKPAAAGWSRARGLVSRSRDREEPALSGRGKFHTACGRRETIVK